MSLRERLEADMKAAMRGGDALTRDTLRMVLATVKSRDIDSDDGVSDDEVVAIVTAARKTRRESVDQFTSAGRDDLAEKERAEIAVLEAYLPQELDEAATKKLLEELCAELGVTARAEQGKVMKALMARHKGAVDGKLASRLLGELLS